MASVLDDRLIKAGKAGRALGAELGLLRLVGPRVRWAQHRERTAQARLGDPTAAFYEEIWAEAAGECGAQMEDLGDEFLELRRGNARTRVRRNLVGLDNPVTLELAGDKPLVHRLLTEAGLPVPDHLAFDVGEPREALSFLERQADPCVVKPARGTDRGTGVTGGVRTREDLLRARLRASRWGSRLLVERRLKGQIYRLLVLDGVLLDVVRRSPPRVTGDGVSTVAALAAAENRRRIDALGAAGFSLLELDLDAVLALRAQGLTLRSVLPAGREAEVKTATSQNRAEENETVRDIAAAIAAEAAAAAGVVGARLAGVDVVTPDRTAPLGEAGGAILEVNTTPGLNPHYLVADRAGAARVAVPILSALLGAR